MEDAPLAVFSVLRDGYAYLWLLSSTREVYAPEHFPADFLIHSARYAADALSVYFVGQWWKRVD